MQANRPQTLGLALDDSPFGLLAWIADKWLSWSDPATPPPDDLILTTATIFWVTRTIAPSMRAYAAAAPAPRAPVPVPTSVTAGNATVLAKYKFNDHIQTGAAVEFPLIGTRDLNTFRLTIDFIFRY